MKPYTKKYLAYFGYSEADFIPCEIPTCGKKAVDIHHIQSRGRGGDSTGEKDKVENLMAMCREHHLRYGDIKQFKEWLQEVHFNFMKSK